MEQGWVFSTPQPSARRRRTLIGAMGVLMFGALGAAVVFSPDGGDQTQPDGVAPGAVDPDSAAAPGSTLGAGFIPPATPAWIEKFSAIDPVAVWEPDSLYVALYGHPDAPVLGVMGEQDIDAAIQRARDVAAGYEGLGRTVVPSFEIIVTVASFEAGPDGDYSNEFADEKFIPWIEAAGAAGLHVVVDLQPGRADFVSQAREIEALLLYPHVSLALDPEWRVGPTGTPGGGFIGTVDAVEVNDTITYLDELTASNGLPPKMMVLHQFRPAMITDKQSILSTPNVEVVIQMDGFGTFDHKLESWRLMVEDLPPGAFTGWKNFYDEDSPTPTPAESLSVRPQPVYISYQ